LSVAYAVRGQQRREQVLAAIFLIQVNFILHELYPDGPVGYDEHP